MTDDLEPRLHELLAERGRPDPSSTGTLIDGIGRLPARTSRPPSTALAAVLVVAVVGIGAFLAWRSVGPGGGSPVPPDPAAFAGDPRMDACFAAAGPVEFAFEMPHARDYQRHLPAMGRSPELEVDDPAFALIFAPGNLQIGYGGAPGAGGGPGRSPDASQPGHRAVCVLVGDSPNLYTDVDITGFQVAVADLGPSTASFEPTPTETADTGPTVEPAPAWVADLVGQLECDGSPAVLGQEVENPGPLEPSATPDEALKVLFLNYWNLPTTGYEPTEVDGHWARYRYLVDGRVKAIAVSTNRFESVRSEVGWEVVGIRACDSAEFDPSDTPDAVTTVWLDDVGGRVRTDIINSSSGPAHCGWETTVFLDLRGVQYFRDPRGVLAAESMGRFDPDAKLPADAIDTGFHTPDWHLFTVPAGDAVYVRTDAGGVERWPRAREEVGCA